MHKLKGRKQTKEYIEKRKKGCINGGKNGMLGKKHSEMSRKKTSQSAIKSHWAHNKTGSELADIKNKIIQGQSNKKYIPYSKTEIILCELLASLNVDYIFQYTVKIKGFITRVDIYIPNKNLCIYVDGEYWHSLPGCRERDERANRILSELGYKVLRFPESTVKFQLDPIMEQILNS